MKVQLQFSLHHSRLHGLMTFFILLSILFLSCIPSPHHACNQLDRDSLLSFHHNFTSSLNWSVTDCCLWEGIACNRHGRITYLTLPLRGLTGGISPSLLNLTRLSYLNLSHNSLSGPIPDGLFSSLKHLKILDLSLNNLTGKLPSSLSSHGLSSSIRSIDLSRNSFSGMLPLEIGRLFNMEKLLLHSNYLNGSIPPSLMNCTNLKTLNLRANLFSGDISVLDFSSLLQLSTLDLGNNYLTGKLPFSLYSCKSLTSVRLANNQLEGQITPDMLALQSLSYLSLSSNRITNINGAFRILMGLKNLQVVILNNNFFNEILPTDEVMGNLDGFQNLWVLELRGCQLRGQVPFWLAKLDQLEVLDLSNNQITGSIPYGLGTLSSLFYINMSNNLISGEFPQELTKLQMASLKLSTLRNSDGEILLFDASNDARYLEYGYNYFLPSAICLRNNSLSGSIPEIDQLKLLFILDISLNNFSGYIPDQISNLTNLEWLDLSGNQLSGKIPASLMELTFLEFFNVSDNNLQGPIPLGGQFDTFDNSSFAGNPGLCGGALLRECWETTTNGDSQKNDIKEEDHDDVFFVISIVFGFIVGFWGVCGTLFLNSTWRLAYFRFLGSVYDWIYVIIAVNVARLKRWLQS